MMVMKESIAYQFHCRIAELVVMEVSLSVGIMFL